MSDAQRARPRDLDDVDPTFARDLEESKKAVQVAVEVLLRAGIPAVSNPVVLRPDVRRRMEYSDKGDIVAALSGGPVRVESKHRPKLAFTDRRSFPWPSIIVDVAHCWDNADPKPLVYFIFNSGLTHYGLVWGESSPSWTKADAYDNHANRVRPFYYCPTELVDFMEVRT